MLQKLKLGFMKKKIIILCLIFLFIILVSCEIGFSCDLYVKDIVDISFGVYEICFTNAIFVFQVSEENQDLNDFIYNNFRDVENLRYEEDEDYNMYLVFDSRVPIISKDNIDKLEDKDLFAIVAKTNSDRSVEQEFQFGLYMNKIKFFDIHNFIKEKFYSTISMSNLHLFIDLYNNFAPNLKISLNAIYVNDEPIIYPEDFVLPKGEIIRLRLSDVIKDYIYNNDYLFFGKISF